MYVLLTHNFTCTFTAENQAALAGETGPCWELYILIVDTYFQTYGWVEKTIDTIDSSSCPTYLPYVRYVYYIEWNVDKARYEGCFPPLLMENFKIYKCCSFVLCAPRRLSPKVFYIPSTQIWQYTLLISSHVPFSLYLTLNRLFSCIVLYCIRN